MKRVIRFTILAALLLILLSGCDLFEELSTQTIKQCMTGFIAAAESGNYGACPGFIHPESPVSGSNSTYFSNLYGNASFGTPSYSGSSAYVDITYGIEGTYNETFTFRQDADGNWLIYTLTFALF